jgi:tight adherence protein C
MLQVLGVAFIVSAILLMFIAGAYQILFPPRTPAERLADLLRPAERQSSEEGKRRDIIQTETVTVWQMAVARLAVLAQGGDQAETERIRINLVQAGYRSKRAPDIFNGVRVALVVTLPIFATPLAAYTSLNTAMTAMFMMAVFGYLVPMYVIEAQATSRRTELVLAFPDALDMLTTSVESGMSLDAAFRRVASELAAISKNLSRELAMVNSEVSAGISRSEALLHLDSRCGIAEIKSFVGMISQSERYGASISEALRVYSLTAREKRLARAEEAAGQSGNMMTIYMIMFLMPVLLTVLMGPVALNIMNDYMAGG